MHSKKHLSFTAIRNMIAENLATIKDTRAANSSNTIVYNGLKNLDRKYAAIPNMSYAPVTKIFNATIIQKYTQNL